MGGNETQKGDGPRWEGKEGRIGGDPGVLCRLQPLFYTTGCGHNIPMETLGIFCFIFHYI